MVSGVMRVIFCTFFFFFISNRIFFLRIIDINLVILVEKIVNSVNNFVLLLVFFFFVYKIMIRVNFKKNDFGSLLYLYTNERQASFIVTIKKIFYYTYFIIRI